MIGEGRGGEGRGGVPTFVFGHCLWFYFNM